jgi:GNAT superfamily N-acetyltransferase
VDFRIEARAYDDPDVARLVAAVQAEYVLRYGGPDEAEVDVAQFRPPAGLFLVGILDGEPAVTGGWRRRADGVVEIKRMYVPGTARRRGLARLMLAELEASARAAGALRIELNTGDRQPEAIRLYQSSGYLLTGGFGRYAGAPGAMFYGKDLVPDGVISTRQ